jgi:dTDP-4-amino-4,6-dideoxygalactose transaminase
VEGIRLCTTPKDTTGNYAYFPVVVEEAFPKSRDEIFDILAQNNIGARKYFYPLTSAYECYRGLFDPQDTPIALDISHRVLTLPMYADLELDMVHRICDILLQSVN